MSIGSAMPPWHLWGNSVLLSASSGVGTSGRTSQQLFRVNYKRPETWSFFFGAQIVSGAPETTVGPGNVAVEVGIKVITGIGRTTFEAGQLPSPAASGLVTFQWLITPGQIVARAPKKWTTAGNGAPDLRDDVPGSSIPVEWISGQDLQASVELIVTGTFGQNVGVQVTGFVAPRSHVRPDWFRDHDEAMRFRGDEYGGT